MFHRRDGEPENGKKALDYENVLSVLIMKHGAMLEG